MTQSGHQPLSSDFLPEDVALALGISSDAMISPAPQGMTSEVAFVADRHRTCILKHCRNPVYLEWLRREHRVLVALSDSPLRIPRVLAYHEARVNGQVAGAWLLMTRLSGQSLWDLMLRATPVERTAHFLKLGGLLRELHSTPPPAAFLTQAPWLDRKLQEARKNLEWCDGSAELLARLERTKPAPAAEVLIHGDLALDNVLLQQDGRMSLIDWPGGDLGDPRYDISLALATEPELHLRQADKAAFFDGCGAAELDAGTMSWFVDLYEFF